MALKDVDPDNNREYHISFDMDSLDRLESPSTTIALPGGLTLREAIYAVETINETGRLGGVDVVELNPEIGTETDVKRTVDSAIAVLKAACGTARDGMLPNGVNELAKPNSN